MAMKFTEDSQQASETQQSTTISPNLPMDDVTLCPRSLVYLPSHQPTHEQKLPEHQNFLAGSRASSSATQTTKAINDR